MDLGDEVKNDIGGPFKKWYESATKALGGKPAPSKAEPAQSMNWKPEANDEQKAEMKRSEQKPVARKKMPRKR